MQKCSLHSKVALLFTRKLVQEQTDQWKGGEIGQASFLCMAKNTEKFFIHRCIGMLAMSRLIKMRSHFLVVLIFGVM